MRGDFGAEFTEGFGEFLGPVLDVALAFNLVDGECLALLDFNR